MESWEIEVFFDGACPLCKREIAMLRRLDREGRIRFTDIAAPAFQPESLGLSLHELNEKIRGRLPDGTWLEGVEVFRRLYSAVGFKRLVHATRWQPVAGLLDQAYAYFAANRLRWTGRCVPDSDGVCSTA